MEIRNEYLVAGVVVTGVTSIASFVYALVTKREAKDMEEMLKGKVDVLESIEEKLNKKIDSIADSVDVNVPDYIVEEALRKAAEREASLAIANVSRKITNEYESSIKSEVRKSVDLAYSNTKIDVKNELAKQISNVDISGIKREIVEEAKDKVKEELDDAVESIRDKFEEELDEAKESATTKFEEELDSIATRFSNDLERGSKIYKTISDKLGTS